MKKQIPNLLSLLRLFMIPVFVVCYFKYVDFPNSMIAAGVYFLAWATDVLDGYLARRNNWITDIGKLLDPLADKLMQVTAAVCFAVDNSVFLIVVIPIVIKELGMLFGALAIMKKRKVVVQAHWYGKLATVLLFVCAFFRICIRNSMALDISICVIMLVTLIFSLAMYYFKDFKGKYNLNPFRKQ